MTRVIIADTDRFRLISYGNGASYALLPKFKSDKAVMVQGDDATEFRELYEAYCTVWCESPIERVLSELWSQYVN